MAKLVEMKINQSTLELLKLMKMIDWNQKNKTWDVNAKGLKVINDYCDRVEREPKRNNSSSKSTRTKDS